MISISLILHKFLQDGCNSRLSEWFEENKITWVTTLASVVAVQIMSCGIALYMLSRVKRINKLKSVQLLYSLQVLVSASACRESFRVFTFYLAS